MQLYEELLAPLDAALVERAVMEIIRSEREFAPPVGAICCRTASLELELNGERALNPEEAWAELSAAVRRHGYYQKPDFSHQVLAQAVAALDWAEICTNPNLEATRAHFLRVFRAFQQRRIARRVAELNRGPGRTELADLWPAALPEYES